jgi:hypothetical protein
MGLIIETIAEEFEGEVPRAVCSGHLHSNLRLADYEGLT